MEEVEGESDNGLHTTDDARCTCCFHYRLGGSEHCGPGRSLVLVLVHVPLPRVRWNRNPWSYGFDLKIQSMCAFKWDIKQWTALALLGVRHVR